MLRDGRGGSSSESHGNSGGSGAEEWGFLVFFCLFVFFLNGD